MENCLITELESGEFNAMDIIEVTEVPDISILVKDIGFNPLNYSFPAVPIIQYLHTSVDKSVLKEYIMYFGITEIDTDIGLFLNRVKKETYIKYMRDFHSFFFTDNQENQDKEIFTAQIKLEDTILLHKRSFAKMSQVFSTTGGYMQVISTVMTLIALFTKKFSLEQKLLNSLFNFNIKQRKIILSIEYEKKLDYNLSLEKKKKRENKFIPYKARKSIISDKKKKDRRSGFLVVENLNNFAEIIKSDRDQKKLSYQINDFNNNKVNLSDKGLNFLRKYLSQKK